MTLNAPLMFGLDTIEAIVLDRDGVINHDSDEYIKSAEEWQPIEGSIEAIAAMTHHQIPVYIATNQAGIARGKFKAQDLDAMHQKMLKLINQAGGQIQKIYHCAHHPDEQCRCRKPKPGMLDDIMADGGFKAENMMMVGDSRSDLQAAAAAGVNPVYVLSGKQDLTLMDEINTKKWPKLPVFNNLFAFMNALTTR